MFNKYRKLSVILFTVVGVFPQSISATEPSREVNKTLEMGGVFFHVTCPNDSSINQLKIMPTGLELDNSPIVSEIDGVVSGVEVADLNNDGFPEIYVYVNSAGSGTYGSLIAYAVNNKKSMRRIYIPQLENDAVNYSGYGGHDEFKVSGGYLVRRFPIYAEGDINANPGNGVRQLNYKLTHGETSWTFVLNKSITMKPDL